MSHLQSDGQVFEDSSIFELDDLFPDFAPLAGNIDLINNKGVKKRARQISSQGNKKRAKKTSSTSESQENKNEGSRDSRKTMHRVIERQRRQEMAGLCASLRSLLPLEYVKGRRATSDHMHEAVNYIKDIEKKIEEMKIRRDMLKKLLNLPRVAVDAGDPNSNTGDLPYCVKVNHCRDGMEILISSSLNQKHFPLSKVLADLLGRGINVISCVSTRGNQSFLHKLEIEVKPYKELILHFLTKINYVFI